MEEIHVAIFPRVSIPRVFDRAISRRIRLPAAISNQSLIKRWREPRHLPHHL